MATATAKAPTKTEQIAELAEKTGLEKKQVSSVLDAICDMAVNAMKPKGAGIFKLGTLLQLKRVVKPATKERQGRNPANGEPMTIKAKPERTVVKAYPLKSAKDAVK